MDVSNSENLLNICSHLLDQIDFDQLSLLDSYFDTGNPDNRDLYNKIIDFFQAHATNSLMILSLVSIYLSMSKNY